MWICVKCGEKLEDAFDVCWKCGTQKPVFEEVDVPPQDDAVERQSLLREANAASSAVTCLRCNRELAFAGTRNFREELFVGKMSLDVYACRNCGHVEFFLTGGNKEWVERYETQ